MDHEEVKKKSTAGVLALTLRTFFLQAVNFGATLLLTVFLSPETFGIYFLVLAWTSFLNYFSDIGLAAALIQKKEEVTEDDLRTTFTIQEIMVMGIVIITFIITPYLQVWFKLSNEAIILWYALVAAFVMSSLKTIPSILLERKIEFQKLIIPQIGEALAFNIISVYLAWKGYGIYSFTYAVLARGVAGLVLTYMVSPWHPRIAFKRESASRLARFGIFFQINGILALIKDDLLVVYLAKVLPMAAVGYLGWAQKWAFLPLRFFMDNVIRVTFPAYSRLQENKDSLKRAVEKSIFAVCTITYPMIFGIVVIAPTLVMIIPKYSKWEPALIPLYFFAINAVFSCVSTTLTNTMNALGKIKITLRLMIMWVILTWTATPLLINYYGYIGGSMASAIVALTSIVPAIIVKRDVGVNFFSSVVPPLISSIIMFASLLLLRGYLTGYQYLLSAVVIGTIVYGISIMFLSGKQVLDFIKLIRK